MEDVQFKRLNCVSRGQSSPESFDRQLARRAARESLRSVHLLDFRTGHPEVPARSCARQVVVFVGAGREIVGERPGTPVVAMGWLNATTTDGT